MNKQQQKQIEMAKAYIANGMRSAAAQSVSAMIRSAMTSKSRKALLDFATEHNLTSQPEFII